MDYTRYDDEALMRLAAGLQTEALSELYDRYSRLVFSIVLNILGDSNAAEDATQDVFLRAWENASSYQASTGKVSTWLASIARHRAIDLLRRSRSRHENQQISLDTMPVFNLTDGHNVEQEVHLVQQQKKVRQALTQLPPEQYQVLAMAYFQGLSQEQIAQACGLPLGTVKTRLRLGMQKLRKQLVEEAPQPITEQGR